MRTFYKKDLKQLVDFRDEIKAKEHEVAKLQEELDKCIENRQRFSDIVTKSSDDRSCRQVLSKVESYVPHPDEAFVKLKLQRAKGELETLKRRYNSLQVEIEEWLLTLPKWKIRAILRA